MLNPNPSPHSDPEVLTRFQEELARAAALPGLAVAGPALWPRFAGYYQGLARLPRRLRRALQRQWRRSLGGIALLCALGQAPALAATIAVDGPTCNLIDAIIAANTDTATGGCTAGSGADTLVLANSSIHTLTSVYGTGLDGVTRGQQHHHNFGQRKHGAAGWGSTVLWPPGGRANRQPDRARPDPEGRGSPGECSSGRRRVQLFWHPDPHQQHPLGQCGLRQRRRRVQYCQCLADPHQQYHLGQFGPRRRRRGQPRQCHRDQ